MQAGARSEHKAVGTDIGRSLRDVLRQDIVPRMQERARLGRAAQGQTGARAQAELQALMAARGLKQAGRIIIDRVRHERHGGGIHQAAERGGIRHGAHLAQAGRRGGRSFISST